MWYSGFCGGVAGSLALLALCGWEADWDFSASPATSFLSPSYKASSSFEIPAFPLLAAVTF